MIDIKTLSNYSRVLNLKQICDLADVSYSNVKQKVQKYKFDKEWKLNERETQNLSKLFVSLGQSFQKLQSIDR